MNNDVVENAVIEEPVVDPVVEPTTEPAVEPEIPADNSFAASQEPVVEDAPVVAGDPVTEPVVEEPVVEEPVVEPVTDPNPEEPETVPAPSVEEQFTALQAEHAELQSTYSALEANFNDLQERFAALETAHAELVEFKRQSDDAKKDEMIGRFYMLSDEDKMDIVSNKANYTVEEIEEKLSVICFRKKINLENNSNTTEQPPVTFNVSNAGASKPDWLIAVDNAKNN